MKLTKLIETAYEKARPVRRMAPGTLNVLVRLPNGDFHRIDAVMAGGNCIVLTVEVDAINLQAA